MTTAEAYKALQTLQDYRKLCLGKCNNPTSPHILFYLQRFAFLESQMVCFCNAMPALKLED